MIGYIKGQIKTKDEDGLIVVASNVGYEIYSPARTVQRLKAGDETELYIHTEVKDDAIDFYGFETPKEKSFFKKIRSAHGIGPKTALSLMSFSLDELKSAIIDEDVSKLTSVHGLGKKGAERLILELKNKLPDSLGDERRQRSVGNSEAYDALQNLGYKVRDIDKVLTDMPENKTKTEDIVRYFLQNL